MARPLALVLLLGCSACYGSGGDDDEGADGGSGGSGNPGQTSACGTYEFILEGALDGQAVSHEGALDGHAWIQASASKTLDTPFVGGGSFHAEWENVVADGETFNATGNVVMPPSGPYAGETLNYTAGALTKLDNGVTFELMGLSISVTCVTDPCNPQSVEGSLQGCVDWTR